jgi:site-specific DNA-methyltransferase (adenine-specific)
MSKIFEKDGMKLLNVDCMDAMKQYPDNYFDLAVCDPPYFPGPQKSEYYGGRNRKIPSANYSKITEWDVPGYDYFNELKRISKKWIIWGCNYYDFGVEVPGRIIWNKCNSGSSFSDCEIAMTNCHDSVRMFTFMWNGMLQGRNFIEGHIMQGDKSKNEVRIHQTQKPVALYEWIFTNYGKEVDKILDTHSGSASSFLAAVKFPLDEFIGFELDPVVFDKSVKRIKEQTAQLSLF